MAVDGSRHRGSLSLRSEVAIGFATVFVVAGVIAAGLALVFWLPTLVWSDRHQGTPIEADQARQFVADHRIVLQRVIALAGRSPHPARDDPTCRELAAALGALDIRLEERLDGCLVRIAFSRSGVAETYETQLTWVPEGVAARVRAGTDRLGERFEYIDDGWWWVFW